MSRYKHLVYLFQCRECVVRLHGLIDEPNTMDGYSLFIPSVNYV